MDYSQLVSLLLAVGLIAFLYSSVGHAGASGYIAVMTLWGVAPTTIRPTALLLNILVASIGALQFWRAGRCASSQSDSDRRWSGNRIPVRPHWNGRRNISHSPSAVLPLGAHSPGGRSLGVIYFGKLNFGANRLLYREPIYSVAWSSPRTRGGDWRRSGFTSRQPPFSHPYHLDLVGDSPGHRRSETDFYQMNNWL